jgi:hypothetical protein
VVDTHVRLLVCNTEGTIEELPDYQGPPEHDDVLNFLSARHKFPSGEDHLGSVGRVETKHWENKQTRKAITTQILDKVGHTGLDPSFYDAKNTLREDAMTCWIRDHNRNPACSDYKTDAKRLTPGTAKDRKALGFAPMRSDTFLCDFCPVKSMVQQAHYDKSGARD